MKKLFSIFVALTVLTLSVSAQGFKKSDKILEGTVSYSKSKGSDAEYSFSPSLGYFVSNKAAIGFTAEMGSSSEGDVSNFGVYGRQYFHTVGKNILTYAQLNVGVNNTNASGAKTSMFGAGFGLGANYFVSNRVAISAHLSDLMSYSSGEGTSSFSVGFRGFNNPLAMTSFGVLVKL